MSREERSYQLIRSQVQCRSVLRGSDGLQRRFLVSRHGLRRQRLLHLICISDAEHDCHLGGRRRRHLECLARGAGGHRRAVVSGLNFPVGLV